MTTQGGRGVGARRDRCNIISKAVGFEKVAGCIIVVEDDDSSGCERAGAEMETVWFKKEAVGFEAEAVWCEIDVGS